MMGHDVDNWRRVHELPLSVALSSSMYSDLAFNALDAFVHSV